MNVEEMFKKDPSETGLTEAVETPSGSPEKEEEKAPTSEGEDTALTEKVAPSTNKRFKDLLERIEDKETEISELKRFKQEVESGKYSQSSEPIPSEWQELFGDNSEKAWNINKSLLQKMEERIAKNLEERENLRKQAQEQETKRWEAVIDKQLLSLEESKGIDATSNAPAAKKLRADLKEIVEEYSPEGSWISFDKAYEILELKKGKTSSTPAKKEIAARSMSRSTGSVIEPAEIGTGSWREKYFPGQ